MNNLHRNLAPISDAAWADIEEEAKRTFQRNIAGRRVVDVSGPHGNDFAAVGLGRLHEIDEPDHGVESHVFRSKPVVQLRVPFTLSREEIDGVERECRRRLKDGRRRRRTVDGGPSMWTAPRLDWTWRSDRAERLAAGVLAVLCAAYLTSAAALSSAPDFARLSIAWRSPSSST